jgi:hypothetical protein
MRRETQTAVWRWREMMVGVAIALAGIWRSTGALGLIWVFWIVVALAGVVVAYAGWQRGRFRTGQGGVGVVKVDEREIGYFGPMEGGVAAIDALMRVELQPAPNGIHNWVLVVWGDAPLKIPANAANVEALFDVFSVLDGFEMQKMLVATRAKSARTVLIWEKTVVRLH